MNDRNSHHNGHGVYTSTRSTFWSNRNPLGALHPGLQWSQNLACENEDRGPVATSMIPHMGPAILGHVSRLDQGDPQIAFVRTRKSQFLGTENKMVFNSCTH